MHFQTDRHIVTTDIETITSPANPSLKLVRKLQRRRARDLEGAFVAEGEDLVLAGLETGARARFLLVDAERVPSINPKLIPCPLYHVQPDLLAAVSELAHPPRIMGVFEQPAVRDLAEVLDARSESGSTGPWIVLDGLGDPGNVGTVIRTAAALRAGGVVTLPDTADPWSSKAVRASMGACFRVPIFRLDASGTDVSAELDTLRASIEGLRIVPLAAGAEATLSSVTLDARTLIVIGGERTGISDGVSAVADQFASIPQDPEVESVNAGVAASIALYEWTRERA